MKEINNKKYFTLLILLVVSSILFSILGYYWNIRYYHSENVYSISTPPLSTAMRGIHDKLYMTDLLSFHSDYAVDNLSVLSAAVPPDLSTEMSPEATQKTYEGILSSLSAVEQVVSIPEEPEVYEFTAATDDYFADACFIGDSRTVGISQYADIENATFLCKTSLTIYDYEKPKITYEGSKVSIHDVLSEKQFAKIYLMVGINECGTGTPESFYERYRDVVMDIRGLQPQALIFIQGNLFVTQKKSDDGDSITNENIAARNDLIATLANQKDIFYININESSLCEDGALVSDYTWDQVHIKAQYYPIWKDFLLQHAIITDQTALG
mgnify:FL=1